MKAQRKVFRIEAMNAPLEPVPAKAVATPAAGSDRYHAEVMAELAAIRSLIRPAEEVSQKVVEAYRSELAEAHKLKTELDAIYEAINQTKLEIATLHKTGFKGPEMTRVTHELDAIVGGTESATERILAAAEEIDSHAIALLPATRDESERGMVSDIQDHVVQIFEACNFQDLTGQRITKVVATLKFIEDRIVRMMDIWGGLEAFRAIEADVMPERAGDARLLNGPKLEDEQGHVSQDDIDALFG